MNYPFETRRVHCLVDGGEVDEPVELMAALAAGPDLVAQALREAGVAGREGWSPVFVAAHLADLEVYRGMRIRRILAEDDPLIETIDQDLWAASLFYDRRSVATSLETFVTNRRANLELVRLGGEAALARPYRAGAIGRTTLGGLVAHTSHHDIGHLRQILGNSE